LRAYLLPELLTSVLLNVFQSALQKKIHNGPSRAGDAKLSVPFPERL